MNANFNFFDQFSTQEVDLTKYLQKFSTNTHQLNLSNTQPVLTTVVNLFDQFKLTVDFNKNINSFIEYQIADGETPEKTSYSLYGVTDFWWLILTINNITNPYAQWPISQAQIFNLVERLYAKERLYTKEKYFDLIFEQNETKRNILVPTSDALYDIIWNYRQALMNGN